ncbi:MAG TPA: hypothetical protein VNU97_13635 [Rhizomicrobium sp.]|jgi:hypothetical protein|nr:hypothetical protein [Rhizomicrobium sp.]
MPNLIVLELNEVSFEIIGKYASRGGLPNFRRFFAEHGYCETTSEVRYAELEPWIQWVSAHTGKTFAEHGIFRLGDTVGAGVPQIWEVLEAGAQLKVGAISPMNAANRAVGPAFFVPDPWTPTAVSGPAMLRHLSSAISQAVNDNATGRLTFSSAVRLMLGIARYARPRNYPEYLRLVGGMLRRPWNKVSFLDLFLSDLNISLNRSARPQFSTLFLNGAAHLQHHYIFNSPEYASAKKNPAWYLRPEADPVGDIYRTYDRILGDTRRAFPGHRIMLMTGLHQDPCPTPIYYWRPKDHGDLLRRLGVVGAEVQPRMSRDFILKFAGRAELEAAKDILLASRLNEERAFSVDDRGEDLFVEFVFARDVPPDAALKAGAATIANFRRHLAFVALKNGFHNGVGFFSDSGRRENELPKSLPLVQVYDEILAVFGLASRRGAPAGGDPGASSPDDTAAAVAAS